jgi:hypothetical protein
MMLEPRLVPGWARRRFWRQILATDVALIALIGTLCGLVGWKAVLLVQLPPARLAGAAGIWLFYVQHQFEGVYWQRQPEPELPGVGPPREFTPEAAEDPSVLHRQHRASPRPSPEPPSLTTTCSVRTTRISSSTTSPR